MSALQLFCSLQVVSSSIHVNIQCYNMNNVRMAFLFRLADEITGCVLDWLMASLSKHNLIKEANYN